MTPAKLDFEKRFEDNSGVKVAARYDVDCKYQLTVGDGNESVHFEIDDITWLIEALQRIQEEVAPLQALKGGGLISGHKAIPLTDQPREREA